MPSRFLRHLLLVTLTLALGLAGPGPATAATFTVTSCADDGGAGTLRDAVTQAAASPDMSDTINFPPGPCLTTLAGAASEDGNLSGDLDIMTKTLVLQGSGPTNTIIAGGAADRVLDIAAAANVTLRNLTIRNGDATQNAGGFSTSGGAIFNAGTLTLENVVLSGSQGAQGGGIFNDVGATLTVTRTTVSGNTATNDGGGLFNLGSLTVTNSTISGNSAVTDGGGIQHGGTAMALTNVTITNNTANSDNTGVDTGGGINSFGTSPTLSNTIVAGNLVGTGGTMPDCQANPALTAANYNLFGNLIECDGGATDVESATPGLGPLADNGGLTPTHALLAGSPAIDAGLGCSATDQRGFPRPTGTACDIGAVERFVSQVASSLALGPINVQAGQTLVTALTVSNPGGPVTVDVLGGILLPAVLGPGLGCQPGVSAVVFLTSVSPVNGVIRCLDAVADFVALAQNVTIPATGQVTVPFFNLTIPPGTPPGAYAAFLILVVPGALDDGIVGPEDIVVLTGGSFFVQ